MALNILMWHRINEERDNKSFMGVEIVSCGRNSSSLFLKSGCVGNCDMKSSVRLALSHLKRGYMSWQHYPLISIVG
jgi:hypothetical protein